jgi:hypothetical protein
MITWNDVEVTSVSIRSQVLPDKLAILNVWVIATQPTCVASPVGIDVGEHNSRVVADAFQSELVPGLLIRNPVYSCTRE